MKNIYTKDINNKYIGKIVIINGWVHRYRILKNYIFIILRDREGLIQIFVNKKNLTLFNLAKKIRQEYCLKVKGIIQLNNNKLEILATKLIIINSSIKLPFDIHNKYNNENIRLKYRYLDLRSSYMINNIKYKNNFLYFIRNYLYKNKYIEIETPILSNPYPEGARNYLIPSRIHKGKYFALPQSPQLYKQLLMISGFDKYYQIAKCFRDENLRSDRQPEFTQLDIETSFMNSKQIIIFIESMIKIIWLKFKKIKLDNFKILSYSKSIEKYATDKPDLRNPLYYININFLLKENIILNYNELVDYIIIKVSDSKKLLNSYLTKYFNFFLSYNIKGFGWIKILNIKDKIKIISPRIKLLLNNNNINKIMNFLKVKNNDIIFFIIDNIKNKYFILDKFRMILGNDLKIINYNKDKFVWIINFPLFKINNEGKLISNHHPFTAPLNKYNEKDIINDPTNIIANDYDLIINGYEVGGGSVRNNNSKIQSIIFNLLNLSIKEQNNQFGFLLDALKYGAPLHAGIALGIERLLMILLNLNNIKDIIAFPKTTNFYCLLTNSPIKITNKELKKIYF